MFMDRNEVRDKAMDIAEEFERKEGRTPKRVHKEGCGYDIRSEGREIEVKGRSGTDYYVHLNHENLQALKNNKNYLLYIVHFDKEGKSKMTIMTKKEIKKNAHRRRQWSIPFRKHLHQPSK